MATGSRGDAERRFWERSHNLPIKQGVKPTLVRWSVQHAEQFIRSFPGCRLMGLYRRDVDDYLGRLGQDSRLQPWQFQQIVDAIRSLSSMVPTEWADSVDWGFWRDSARTREEQHATTAREHAPVTPEEFAQRIGESRFAPLIREHLEVFARFSTVVHTRDLSIRTEKSYLGCDLPDFFAPFRHWKVPPGFAAMPQDFLNAAGVCCPKLEGGRPSL